MRQHPWKYFVTKYNNLIEEGQMILVEAFPDQETSFIPSNNKKKYRAVVSLFSGQATI
jgi:hypothetical protein